MPKKQQHYKTIVLSDIHLGSKWSKTKEVTRFLKRHSCDTLILCGDIIDGWSLMRGKPVNGGGATRILSRCYWTSRITRRLFTCGEIMMISWIE